LNRSCAADPHFESILLRDPPNFFFDSVGHKQSCLCIRQYHRNSVLLAGDGSLGVLSRTRGASSSCRALVSSVIKVSMMSLRVLARSSVNDWALKRGCNACRSNHNVAQHPFARGHARCR
jgi:hypothetical protein